MLRMQAMILLMQGMEKLRSTACSRMARTICKEQERNDSAFLEPRPCTDQEMAKHVSDEAQHQHDNRKDCTRHSLEGPFKSISAVGTSPCPERHSPAATRKVIASSSAVKYQKRVQHQVKDATDMLKSHLPEMDKETAEAALQQAPLALQVLHRLCL
jgi:hypothetical protein